MRRSDEMHPVEAPRVRPLSRWEVAARKALTSGPAERGIGRHRNRQGYVDGLKRAAAFVQERGDRELAAAIRRLAEEGQKEA